MRKLILTEIHNTRNSTVSELRTEKGQFLCFVVEDGYRKIKEYGNTRIPPGTYMIHQRTHGGFYQRYRKRFGHKFVPHLLNVPRFTHILIHIGNTVKDTKGCLLVNSGIIKGKDGNWQGVGSTVAYKKVYNWLKTYFVDADTIYLEVKRRSYV